MNHSTNKATIRGHKTQKNFSSLLRLEFKQVDVAGTGLRPASACALCRNAERGFGTHAGNSSSSSSLRHHNKLIPTSLTSHSRQSYELGARQGRTLAQGAGCWATMRLGLTVTRMLMAGLLGDGDGDVSLRDVSPRDISLYRAFARGALRLWPLWRLHQKQKEEAAGDCWLEYFWFLSTKLQFYSIPTWLKVI